MNEYWERFKSELKLLFYKDNVLFSPYYAYGKWYILDDNMRFKTYNEAVEYSKENGTIKYFYLDDYNSDKDYKEYWEKD